MAHSCPICGGQLGGPVFPYENVWHGVTYTRRRCQRCRTAVVDPPPDPTTLAEIYSWEDYHEVEYDVAPRPTALVTSAPSKSFARISAGSNRFSTSGVGRESFTPRARPRTEVRGDRIRRSGDCRIGAPCRCHGLPPSRCDRAGCPIRGRPLRGLAAFPDPAATMRQLETLLRPGGRFDRRSARGQSEPSALVLGCRQGNSAPSRARRVPMRPPTMLFRINRRAQRQFFTERLGYTEGALLGLRDRMASPDTRPQAVQAPSLASWPYSQAGLTRPGRDGSETGLSRAQTQNRSRGP